MPITVGVITDTAAGLEFGKALEVAGGCTVVVYYKEQSELLKANRDEREQMEKRTQEMEASLRQSTQSAQKQEKTGSSLFSRVSGVMGQGESKKQLPKDGLVLREDKPMLRLHKRTVIIAARVSEAVYDKEVVFSIFTDMTSCLATLKQLPEQDMPIHLVQLTSCDLGECRQFQNWVGERESRVATMVQSLGLNTPRWYAEVVKLPHVAYVASGDKALWDKTSRIFRSAKLDGKKNYLDSRLSSAVVVSLACNQHLLASTMSFMQGVAMAKSAGVEQSHLLDMMTHMRSSTSAFMHGWGNTEEYGKIEQWEALLGKAQTTTHLLKLSHDLANDYLAQLASVDKAAPLGILAQVDHQEIPQAEPAPSAEAGTSSDPPPVPEVKPEEADAAAAAAEPEAPIDSARGIARGPSRGRQILGAVAGSFRRKRTVEEKEIKAATEEAVEEVAGENKENEVPAEEAPVVDEVQVVEEVKPAEVAPPAEVQAAA